MRKLKPIDWESVALFIFAVILTSIAKWGRLHEMEITRFDQHETVHTTRLESSSDSNI
jgi:hypothetical protein